MLRSVPKSAILSIGAATLLGTLAATYPLFLGRSLVSPANGPVAVLYDRAPFVYGATDTGSEPARGTDVGAMMWAILPYTAVQREALAHGEFPLWNRYNLNGQPLWGQGQTFILDPLHLLSLQISDLSWAMDLRFVLARAVFALGSGIVVLQATGSLPAAALVAAAAPFAGHFTSRFNHPAYFSIVYAPWVLAAFGLVLRADSRGARYRAGALLAAATWLQVVGSTPKEGVAALAAVYTAGLVAVVARPARWPDRLGQLDAVAVAGATAVLLTAPHWLVFLDTLSRAWTAYDQAQVQLAGRAQAVSFLLGAVAPGQPFTGTHALFAVAAAGALLSPRALHQSGLGLGALIAVAGLAAVAFGLIPPALLASLPLVRNIHHVWDAFLAAAVPLVAVLAGFGFAAAATVPRRTLATAAAAAAGLAWLVPATPGGLWQALGLLAVAGAGAAMALLASGLVGVPRAGLVCLASLAAVGVGGLHLETGHSGLDAVLMQPRERADIARRSPAVRAMHEAAGGEPFRVASVDTVLLPGTQAYWDLEGIAGPDALRLPELDTLAEGGGLIRTWIWRTILLPDRLDAAARYLDMLGVRFIVARADQVPARASVMPMPGADQLRVIDRPTRWPRAFFTAGVHRVEGTDVFIRDMLAASGPFAAINQRDPDTVSAIGDLPTTGTVAAATGYELTANTTRFRVRSDAAGLAVVSESYVAEDFIATVNGARVPYYRVNRGMKAVRIPGPGDWDVAFEYRPRLWRWSWVLAAIGAAGLAFMWTAADRERVR